jgi:hypothetical protein
MKSLTVFVFSICFIMFASAQQRVVVLEEFTSAT